MKYILVVSDGKPGHYRQSMAVAEAIKALDKETEVVYREVSIGRGKKYILRFLLNISWIRVFFKHLASWRCLRWFYGGIEENECPKYVVSSGKETSMLTACIGMICNAQTFFIGHPKKLDHRLFTAVLSVLDLGFENQIVLETAPNLPYDPKALEIFCAQKGLDPSGEYAVLLIGGDGSGYRYTSEEYRRIVDFVNATAGCVSWLVTTSRRTPPDIERMMEREMNAVCFIPYHRKPEAVVDPFLTLSRYAFVTEESASMVGEAVAAGVDVVTLFPSDVNPDENYRNILKKFEQQKAVRRVSLATLDEKTLLPARSHREHTFHSLVRQLSCWIGKEKR